MLDECYEAGIGWDEGWKARKLGFPRNLGDRVANDDMGVIMIPDGLHSEFLLEAFA